MDINTTKIISFLELARVDKPIGTLLLLYPTLSSLWLLTSGNPSVYILLIFIIGTFLMRSAGCVINDYFDKDFDKLVSRTKDRPLASEKLNSNETLIFFICLSSSAAGLLIFLNKLSFYMALLGFVVTIIYPLTKRFLRVPQLFLGVAFSWGIIMASAAQLNSIPFVSLIMFCACFFWIIAYDSLYALVDIEDDIKIGINSSAIAFGNKANQIILLCNGISVILWLTAGFLLKVNISFYICIILIISLNLYIHKLTLDRNPQNCFKAFKMNNWIGLILLTGSILGTV